MSRSTDGKCPDKGVWCGSIRDWCEGTCEIVEHERLVSENARMKKELDEAAGYINEFMKEVPRARIWLIRNGYMEESYQGDVFGREIYKP